MYKANWVDGNIINWDYHNHNWKRKNQNIGIKLKRINNPKNIMIEFMNEITEIYGITQNPETKDYILILGNKCKKCNLLLCHNDVKKALEWIPYDKFYDVKYNAEGRHKVCWIDGNMINYNQNWERKDQNMIVELKKLNKPKNITLEINEVQLILSNYNF
ncbi:kinase-like domain-containing protein [Rhizophagus clarus]|uniref:Kinase-like domain-containing protein n=1 Tax=Rhizophagus clarus TaxID=94130 RepID=A0A8H3M4X0_9GLOM|nr:kinase-like domain-containing protein [Rhizophagus clarus]